MINARTLKWYAFMPVKEKNGAYNYIANDQNPMSFSLNISVTTVTAIPFLNNIKTNVNLFSKLSKLYSTSTLSVIDFYPSVKCVSITPRALIYFLRFPSRSTKSLSAKPLQINHPFFSSLLKYLVTDFHSWFVAAERSIN